MLLIYFCGWAPHCWTHWGRLCANTKRAMLQVSQIHVLISVWKYPIESFVRLLFFKGCALWHGMFVSNKEDVHARVKNRMSMQMIRVNQKESRPGSDREKWLRHDLGDSIGLETLGIYHISATQRSEVAVPIFMTVFSPRILYLTYSIHCCRPFRLKS